MSGKLGCFSCGGSESTRIESAPWCEGARSTQKKRAWRGPGVGKSGPSGAWLVGVAFLAANVVLTLAAEVSQATVLVAYPFTDGSSGPHQDGLNYTTFDATALASSELLDNSGFEIGLAPFSVDSLPEGGAALTVGPWKTVANATASDSLTERWWFQFTLTPNSTMDIRSISADWSRDGETGTRGWFVRSSLDSYATDLYANTTSDGTPVGAQTAAFNVSGFTNLTQATTFRFYIFTPQNGDNMRFQNIAFSAAVVPEPPASAFAAAPACLVAGWVLRRRFRR